MNKNQSLAYDLISWHSRIPDLQDGPLLLIINGLAVSGKSYLSDAIRNLLKAKCKVAAYFGVAAFNVKGLTLNSLLQLPIRGNRSSKLKGIALT